MVEIALDDLERPEEALPLNPSKDPDGIKSKIHEYCVDPQRQAKSCIWFCRRYGRDVLASDEDIENIESGPNSFKLQRFDKWWSRLGFYNIVGVRHVKVGPSSTHARCNAQLTCLPTCRSGFQSHRRLSTDFQ